MTSFMICLPGSPLFLWCGVSERKILPTLHLCVQYLLMEQFTCVCHLRAGPLCCDGEVTVGELETADCELGKPWLAHEKIVC